MPPTARLAALALLLALAAAPAGAQANPAAFKATLEAQGPAEADPGSVHPVLLTLSVMGHGFACAQDATLPANLTVSAADAAEGVILEVPDNATVTVPQGAYADPVHPFNATVEADARLLVARYADQGARSAFTIRVDLHPDRAEGCTTAGADGASAEATYTVSVTALPPGDPGFHPDHEAHGGAAFDAYLPPGESFSHTFDEPGRYPYHDHLQPERKGLIRVLRYAQGDVNGTEATVRITAAGYEPSDLALKAGTTVTWVNEDNVTRTVSADELHDPGGGLEPEDREALAGTNAENPDDGDAATEAETPAPGALALAAVVAAAALAARSRRSGRE